MFRWRFEWFRFLWFDAWIGVYYDRNERVLYIAPLPCCIVKLKKTNPEDV